MIPIEKAEEVIWLDYGGARYAGSYYDPQSQLVTVIQARATARAAVHAYLTAIADDQATIDTVARILCIGQGEIPDTATPYNKHVDFLWQHYRKDAKDALTALIGNIPPL